MLSFFCQLFASRPITWTVFSWYRFNQLCRLLAAVEMFAKRYMVDYFLLLHIFQTTSVNARWGQPWIIQPQNFPKQVSGWCFCKNEIWNKFSVLNLLACCLWLPLKTWLWRNSGYQLPSVLSKGKCETFKGEKFVGYWWWMHGNGAPKWRCGTDANVIIAITKLLCVANLVFPTLRVFKVMYHEYPFAYSPAMSVMP